MKITKEDKEKLFKMMDGALLNKIDEVKKHRALKLGIDIEKRFRWDCFWASKIKIGDGIGIDGDINLYAYMNDDHIDTALKNYIDNRKCFELN